MIKSIVPALLVVGGACSALAEDQVAKPLLGFEFGASFNLYNDSRFEGNGTHFSLIYQVDARLKAAVYHEQGHIHGEENGNDANIDVTINQFRVGLDLWTSSNGSQDVGLMFGFGSASYTEDIDTNELVADVVVRYSPIRAKNGPVVGALNINASYRYAPLDNVNIGGFTAAIDDLGGFIIGLGAGLYF